MPYIAQNEAGVLLATAKPFGIGVEIEKSKKRCGSILQNLFLQN